MVLATKVWKKSERALQVSKIENKYKFILKQNDFYTYILIFKAIFRFKRILN